MPLDIAKELAARAFRQGFAVGANELKRAAGHTVDLDTHAHWRAGFEAGRTALDRAVAAYRAEVLR